jgi:hypothetical protein
LFELQAFALYVGNGRAFHRIDGSGTSELTRDRHDPGATSPHWVVANPLPTTITFSKTLDPIA